MYYVGEYEFLNLEEAISYATRGYGVLRLEPVTRVKDVAWHRRFLSAVESLTNPVYGRVYFLVLAQHAPIVTKTLDEAIGASVIAAKNDGFFAAFPVIMVRGTAIYKEQLCEYIRGG